MDATTESGNFGRSVLYKQGWKEGKGLGKNESGITDAIKASIKHDTAGLGHDYGKEFTDSWWNNVFNKAASNLVVEVSESDVHVKSKKIKPEVIKKKPSFYSNFIKSAVLDGSTGGETSVVEESATSVDVQSAAGTTDQKSSGVSSFTDEELLTICGGRTAHKAARHGFRLDGKLLRVQEQEALLMRQHRRAKASASPAVVELDDDDVADGVASHDQGHKKKKGGSSRKPAETELRASAEAACTATSGPSSEQQPGRRKRKHGGERSDSLPELAIADAASAAAAPEQCTGRGGGESLAVDVESLELQVEERKSKKKSKKEKKKKRQKREIELLSSA